MKLSKNPRISVVTVCYNAEKEIEKTMLSVLHQTYNNIEYIVIDGGSKDGTVEIINKYKDRLSYWVSEPDKGIYDAMNKGIASATGDWILFMNAGDAFYSEDALEAFVPEIEEDTDIAYGNMMVLLEDYQYKFINKNHDLKNLKSLSMLPHQATFTRLSYHKQHPFDISFVCAADYNFFYQAYFKDKCKFQYIPVIVSTFDGVEGLSSTQGKYALREFPIIQGRTSFWYTKVYLPLKTLIKFKMTPEMRYKRLRSQGYVLEKREK